MYISHEQGQNWNSVSGLVDDLKRVSIRWKRYLWGKILVRIWHGYFCVRMCDPWQTTVIRGRLVWSVTFHCDPLQTIRDPWQTALVMRDRPFVIRDLCRNDCNFIQAFNIFKFMLGTSVFVSDTWNSKDTLLTDFSFKTMFSILVCEFEHYVFKP